jgi:hypothetical protein
LECNNIASGRAAIINKFTLVIQEYFHERVEAWLDTVGKKLIGIKHHWLRYEFAPSRGQIHAHMLAICDNNDVLQKCQSLKHDKKQLANYLASWLGDTLGMTAVVNTNYAGLDLKEEVHPSKVSYGSLVQQDMGKDVTLCQLNFQKHKCSKYCMRDRKKPKVNETIEERKRRYCRSGAGIERNYGKCDTPGFIERENPTISRDPRGFDRVDLPRNNRWVVQASSFLCQGWRGNCDIQYLLYSSDSDEIDVSDISRVTNYIVSYSCKGNETEVQAKLGLKAVVMAAQDEHGDDRDVRKLARRLLNEASKTRVISKQEATCQLAGLELYSCSEKIQTESVSGEQRLGTEQQSQTTLLYRYANRSKELHELSLHAYFDHVYNKPSDLRRTYNKRRIPMFTGARCEPTYPVNAQYARGVFLIYHPWHGRFDYDCDAKEFIDMFKRWILDENCPKVIRLGYERAKRLKFSKEPTSETADIDYEAMTVQPDEDTRDLVDLVSTIFTDSQDPSESSAKYDFGKDHNWSTPAVMVRKKSNRRILIQLDAARLMS